MTSSLIKIQYFNRFFTTWVIKYSFISKKINGFINQNLDTILGRYRLNNAIINVYIKNGKIFVNKANENDDLLHHVNKFNFIVKRKLLFVEFNKMINDRLAICVTDYKHNSYCFYKVA